MTTASTVFMIARRLLSDVQDALAAAGLAVDVAAVYPAAVAWDSCDCGTLAVAVQRQYVTDNFPTIPENGLPCQVGFVAADLVVQVLRCAPAPTGMKTSPPVEALQSTAEQTITDGWIVLSTVQCTLSELDDEGSIVGYVVRPQIFAGPAGGCVGSAVGVTISVEQSNLV